MDWIEFAAKIYVLGKLGGLVVGLIALAALGLIRVLDRR